MLKIADTSILCHAEVKVHAYVDKSANHISNFGIHETH